MKNRKTRMITTRYNESYYDIRINRMLLEELIVKLIKITIAVISILAVVAIIGLSEAIIKGEAETVSLIIYIISWVWVGLLALVGYHANK